MLAKKELQQPTNRLMNGYSTSLAMKPGPGIVLSGGLRADMALIGFLEKQVLENQH